MGREDKSDSFEQFECLRLRRIVDSLTLGDTEKEKRSTMTHSACTATLPTEAEVGVAKETSRLLATRLKQGAAMQLRILDDDTSQGTMNLPAPAVGLLLRILEEMARGNAVTIIPVHAELTTQEAADMLNISRPSLIQLLDDGKMEYRRVGTHRRVRFDALMRYKRYADGERRAVLDELAAYDQELGI
jgi:excisionase family DNA binding protein